MGGAAPHGRWAEELRRAGSPGKLDTLLWGGAGRAEPGARRGRRGEEGGVRSGGGRRKKGRKGEKERETGERTYQGMQSTGEKMHRRPRQSNEPDAEGKGNLIIFHFVGHFRWWWCWGATWECRR